MPCKRCAYSAICLTQMDGWRQVFTMLFFQAAKHTGLFEAFEGRIIISGLQREFEVATAETARYWRETLIPKNCPNSRLPIDVIPAIDSLTKEADVHIRYGTLEDD